jgi:hypothetical protein
MDYQGALVICYRRNRGVYYWQTMEETYKLRVTRTYIPNDDTLISFHYLGKKLFSFYSNNTISISLIGFRKTASLARLIRSLLPWAVQLDTNTLLGKWALMLPSYAYKILDKSIISFRREELV